MITQGGHQHLHDMAPVRAWELAAFDHKLCSWLASLQVPAASDTHAAAAEAPGRARCKLTSSAPPRCACVDLYPAHTAARTRQSSACFTCHHQVRAAERRAANSPSGLAQEPHRELLQLGAALFAHWDGSRGRFVHILRRVHEHGFRFSRGNDSSKQVTRWCANRCERDWGILIARGAAEQHITLPVC